MASPFPIHELASLPSDVSLAEFPTEQLFSTCTRPTLRSLQTMGFVNVTPIALHGSAKADFTLSALAGGQRVLICFAPAVQSPMALCALSVSQCGACDNYSTDPDVFYASFFSSPNEGKLFLLGPVLVRRGGSWLTNSGETAQFLPIEMRNAHLPLFPLLGGLSLFKMRCLLAPHMIAHGKLPKFSVGGLFENKSQDNSGLFALLGAAPPAHMALVRKDGDKSFPDFVRPVFFYGDSPDCELTLNDSPLLKSASELGLIELSTAAETTLLAECLETVLFPNALPAERQYRWTLSLVVEHAYLPDRTHKDFDRGDPKDLASDAPRFTAQDALSSYASFTARLLSITPMQVDGAPVQHWRLRLMPDNEQVFLHAFVSAEVAATCSPEVGDIVLCCGHLHASPDALIEDSVPAAAQSASPLLPAESSDASLTEAAACRILCNAVCTHEWAELLANTHDDLSYTSLMNGTKLSSKQEFIRYMSERRQMWRQQRSWQGMSWDTGVIIYRGEPRPCYMLSCFGRAVGASILSLQDGKIAAIETLPEAANASFTPDEDCSVPSRIFHPFRGHLTPHPAEHTPLQFFAATYLRKCMMQHTGYCAPNSPDSATPSSKARWVKLVRDEPSFCDMAFAHGEHVFAVCAVEVSSHPHNGGELQLIAESLVNKDRYLACAEQHGLIPCIFPAQRNYSPEPSDTWNLWDLRTLQPVRPEQMHAADVPPPLSPWEILLGTLAKLRTRITRMGGSVIAYHDSPDIFPHFWYRDSEGKLSWIIMRCASSADPQDSSLSEEEMLPIQQEPNAAGYLVYATAYGDASYSKPARRGEIAYLKLSELMPLHG